jgi:hypothetical protein
MAQKYIMYLLPCGDFGDAVAGGQNLPMQLHHPIFAFGRFNLKHRGYAHTQCS